MAITRVGLRDAMYVCRGRGGTADVDLDCGGDAIRRYSPGGSSVLTAAEGGELPSRRVMAAAASLNLSPSPSPSAIHIRRLCSRTCQGSSADLVVGVWCSRATWTRCRLVLSLGHSSFSCFSPSSWTSSRRSGWDAGANGLIYPWRIDRYSTLRPLASEGGLASDGGDLSTWGGQRRRRRGVVGSGKNAWTRVDGVKVVGNESLLEEEEMEDQSEERRSWVDVSDQQQQTDNRLVLGEKTLQINKADYTVSSVLDKIRRGKLDLRPSYQRDFVWDKKTASKLIESLLLNIPVPTLFFHERQKGVMEVVDGKQRLTSIWSFIEQGTFPDGSEFALTGLEVLSRLNNKTYVDLDESYKEAIQDFALNVHTISRHSDEDVVFEVFERLNMGSTQLNEQELRNCIYQGSYNNLLDELATSKDMLKVMKSDVPHKRMRDRELILRFFALRRGGIDGFIMPVKKWLNEEMRINQSLSALEKEEMKMDFERSISLAYKVFGDQAFRILRLRPNGAEAKWEADVNAALWDTIMFGFSLLSSIFDDEDILEKGPALRQACEYLMTKDARFRSSLISNPKAMEMRWKLWGEVLMNEFGIECDLP